MDTRSRVAPMAGAGFAAFRGKFACAWERLFSTSRAGQHKTARRLPRWPERVSPPFTGKLACMEPPHMGIVRASHRRKNSHVRGNAASAHLAPDNTKPLAKRSDGRRGSRLLSQENSHAWNRPHMGIVRDSHRRKNSHVRGNAASAHLAPDNTKPLAKRSDGRRGSRLLSQENSHAWNRRTWNCQRQPSKKNLRTHGSASSAHLAPDNTKTARKTFRWPA